MTNLRNTHLFSSSDPRLVAALALLLCTGVAGFTVSKASRAVEVLPPPTVQLWTLPPPVVVTLEKNAEWDQPVVITAPAIDNPLLIPAPVLEAPVAAAEVPGNGETEAGESDPFVPTIGATISAALTSLEPPSPDLTVSEEGNPISIQDYHSADIAPGTLVQTIWTAGEALHGAQIPTPVLVARGVEPGPRLCVTAAVHGDELNGIEAVRRLMYSVNPDKLSGTIVGVPIVNLQGFQRQSRYLSDRRDLNRFFPGNPSGSSASRMAYSFFHDIVAECDGLVDLHTGSFHRTNLPQLRADLHNSEVLALTQGFGSTVILHSTGGEGTLRRAAVESGIPAVTLEAGEPLRLQEDSVEHTVKALFTLLDTMSMYNKRSLWGNPEPTYYSSTWVRADQGGILMSTVKLGKKVGIGDLLGTVTNPISNRQVEITAPYTGRVIGMALNQFVMPGFATFHLATEGAPDEVGAEEHYHAEDEDLIEPD